MQTHNLPEAELFRVNQLINSRLDVLDRTQVHQQICLFDQLVSVVPRQDVLPGFGPVLEVALALYEP
jgi:hypothetical protein